MPLDWTHFTHPDPFGTLGQADRKAYELGVTDGFTMIANTDVSPHVESVPPCTLEKPYLQNSYTQPPLAVDQWVDAAPLNAYVESIEISNDLAPARRTNALFFDATSTTSTLPFANSSQWAVNPIPFSHVEHNGNLPAYTAPRSVSFSAAVTTQATSNRSRNTSSSTPSLCDDNPAHLDSPLSSLKPESPTDLAREPSSPPAHRAHGSGGQRKRGRPRLNRSSTDPTNIEHAHLPNTALSNNKQRRPSTRLPHNQVERKYREGLNSELERLRDAVPTLRIRSAGFGACPPKPSKAMVLAAAIDYIRAVEDERDGLRGEVERLRARMKSLDEWEDDDADGDDDEEKKSKMGVGSGDGMVVEP